jgi:hypothetical protein
MPCSARSTSRSRSAAVQLRCVVSSSEFATPPRSIDGRVVVESWILFCELNVRCLRLLWVLLPLPFSPGLVQAAGRGDDKEEDLKEVVNVCDKSKHLRPVLL